MTILNQIAICGFLVLCAVGLARGEDERRAVEQTVRVTVRVDGENVSGKVVGWDDGGAWIETRADGGVRAAWEDFGAKRAYDVRRRVIGTGDWAGWARLGGLMLELNDERLADRAFGIAEKKHDDARAARSVIRRMRGAHQRGNDVYAPLDNDNDDRESEPADKDGEGESPKKKEDGSKGPDERDAKRGVHQWETLTEAQHAKETERLRRLAQGMLIMGDFEIEAIETDHFLLYSDLQASETEKWAVKLDTMYRTLIATLDIPEGTRMFRGRCVVYIFKEREDFMGFEAAAFGYSAKQVGGVCHQRGEDVFISFYKGRRAEQDFQSVLIHEAVHGFMYRYRSSKRLPTWANEGLADYVAGYLTQRSTEPQRHWQHVRNFIMRGGDAASIMDLNYRDKSWPTDDSYPVSHMLVRFMLKHRAPAFKQWIDDVKAGENWERALEARFGVTRDVLGEGFSDEMQREKRYTRLR